MASNLHKDLTDLQLHVPKGFAGASNSTTCQKDGTGNLVWAVAGGGGGTNSNVKLSLSIAQVQHLKYDDAPQTLVTGVALKIIQPISILVICNYASGFQENSTTDLRAGWDAPTTGSIAKYVMGQRNLMNLEAIGLHSYYPIMGTANEVNFSVVGKDFDIYSTDAFNGNFSMDIYFNYTLIDV